VRRLKPGDLLVIKSIDRLGRNYNDILVQWQSITKDIGADILVIDMDLLDTRNKDGNLTGTLIADLVLEVMAYFAQTERESIRQRQAEGIAAAKAKGKQFGRKPLPLPDGFESVCVRCAKGEMSTRAAATVLDMSHSRFYRNYQTWQKEKSVSVCRPDGTEPKVKAYLSVGAEDREEAEKIEKRIVDDINTFMY